MVAPAELLLREKDRARTLLADGYARDLVEQDELDERLEQVERARTVAEVQAATAGLAAPVTAALVPVDGKPELVRALLGSIERHGAWTASARMQVRALFGSVVLDLRQAVLPPGPLEIDVRVTFGSLDILVPPGWQVDNRCGAVLASVEQDDSPGEAREPRVLRLLGRVVLGSLAVRERLPGESGGEARRRRKRERKQLASRHARALSRGE
ncbi:MAG: hypothetical protein JNL82_15685 [Myxococcales bacterium]|nr:hypothetical protein [Myxococcales bacterium]